MTTIAYRDGVMVADRQAYLGRGEAGHARKCKLHRLDDGTLIGLSSCIVGAAFQFVRWYKEGADPESWPIIKDASYESNFEALVVLPSGQVMYYHDCYLPTTIEVPYIAIGSGSAYAHGAMFAGATAAQAVAAGCEFDNHSGGGMDAFALNGVPIV